MKKSSLVIMVSMMVLMLVGISSLRVKCQEQSYYHTKQYEKQMEQKYVEQVRTVLDKAGYVNSGIMLTKCVDVDGTRTYTLNIHNKKLSYSSAQGINQLQNEIYEIELPVEHDEIVLMGFDEVA